ncbi:MAG TPA: hypothetical protein VFL83_16145 [Anaeromyxobacter sp.]|nr:hypothetical protein [Anaeromyxobacter sp.]
MTTKERQAKLVEILNAWQRIESESIAQCGEIAERTANPVLRLVMEIIRRDSAMHHKVQQFVIDAIEKEPVSLRVEDLEAVWAAIEAHIASERATERLAAEARAALAGTKDVVQQYLLAYLAADERKHDELLAGLDLIKRGMYRSA